MRVRLTNEEIQRAVADYYNVKLGVVNFVEYTDVVLSNEEYRDDKSTYAEIEIG